MPELSRRKLAIHATDRLLDGDTSIVQELAAYLIASGRERESELLVRDIEQIMSDKGILVADVTTAHTLDKALEEEIISLLKKETDSTQVVIRTTVDPLLIGGMKIVLPDQLLDTSVRRKLTALSALKR